jgi:hypothetical protein
MQSTRLNRATAIDLVAHEAMWPVFQPAWSPALHGAVGHQGSERDRFVPVPRRVEGGHAHATLEGLRQGAQGRTGGRRNGPHRPGPRPWPEGGGRQTRSPLCREVCSALMRGLSWSRQPSEALVSRHGGAAATPRPSVVSAAPSPMRAGLRFYYMSGGSAYGSWHRQVVQ